MCLDIYSIKVKDLNKKFKNNKVIYYKVVYKHFMSNYLSTPFQGTTINSGYFIADPVTDKRILCRSSYISSGAIHVYTTKKIALKEADFNDVVIPVICNKKDFIAIGQDGDACFTKVFIRKKDYEKALKAKSKYAVVGR